MRVCRALIIGVSALASLAGNARMSWAETPAASPTPAPKASDEYRTVYRGITVGGGFETGTFGQAIPAHAGFESAGVKSFEGKKYLLQWDVGSGLTGGYGGNEHPAFWFYGLNGNATGELGLRTMPSHHWSPYGGAGGTVNGSAVAVTSTPIGTYDSVNNMNGLAGINMVASPRLSLGASYLNGRHALELTAFVQESLRVPGNFSESMFYTEVGARAKYDLSQSLSVMAEALYGKSGQMTDSAAGSTTTASHAEAVASFRKMFGHGFWASLDGKVTEDGNKTTYVGTPIIYNTSKPIAPSIGLTVGIPIE